MKKHDSGGKMGSPAQPTTDTQGNPGTTMWLQWLEDTMATTFQQLLDASSSGDFPISLDKEMKLGTAITKPLGQTGWEITYTLTLRTQPKKSEASSNISRPLESDVDTFTLKPGG